MASTRASISKASKRPKINIIPPKQFAPNAPSKTPSTKDTSSSSIDYIPKSPTSSTSLSPNGYLNPPTSPPPRVSPPPPTQENASMDITLTLSPITPLDVQFNTPSPSPPIVGHPIPWNLLEAHGDSCLRTIDQLVGGKLRDLNAEESWALLEDLALYDNKSWNDLRDFAKPVKAIALPQDVPSTSDRRLIKLENQVQRLMEAHLALTQPTQVRKKITTPCEIYSGPHDTQYCMEDTKQAFVEYASSCTDEAGEGLVSEFMASQDARLSKFEANFKRQQGEMTNKIDTVLKAITDQIAGTLPSDTVKNPKLGTHPVSLGNISSNPHPQPDPLASIATEQVRKLNSMLESLGLVPQSSNTKFVCTKEEDGEVMFIKIIRDNDEPQNKSLNEGKKYKKNHTLKLGLEYLDGMDDEGEVTADENLVIPLEEIQLDDKLHFIEEPVEIMDREVKQLKQSRIPIVKVRWNSRRGPEFTWEREDFFMKKYPHLFPSKKRGRGDNRAPGRRSLKEGRM
ncbi:hypothetical protein Tco_0922192 [Tanacetum coccineum]|uniref:Reverse transcriptase domain-containing protein n=1 Tax=Tanacetum coccineum TaxID=301880 RepID=A0ABQ5CZS7_9ASTR